MTVSSSTNRVSYSGNGSLTAFAYTFKVFDQDDLTVILRASDGTETVQTLTTNYTVSGVGNASGGNVTFTTAPATGVTVVILREQPLTQGLDLVPNDPFPAQSLEESLDKLTFITQQHSEELGRTIKASKTNTISGADFTISASDRANKIFAFDSDGDVSITQELGTNRGNWATSTAYSQRDIVRDSSTGSIYIVNSAHTSTGTTPLDTNINSAKYDVIFDVDDIISGSATLTGNLTVNGITTLNGDTTLGDSTNDIVTINSLTKFGNDIRPTTGDVYDIGRSTDRFADIWINGTLYANDTNSGVTAYNITVSNALTVNGDVTLGNSLSDEVTFNADVVSNIMPNSDAARSLGDQTKRWNNVYAKYMHTTNLYLEGVTNDGFETALIAEDPTADRTITFPDDTGTVALLGTAQDFTAQQTFSAGQDIDNGEYIGWGSGSQRPAITGDKTTNDLEFWTGGFKRVDITNSGLDVTGNITATGSATITGNLTVNGTTTTISTTNTVVSDALMELGNGTTGTPANDAGIVIERGDSDNAFIGWDESTDKFIVGTGSFTGASTGDLTITTGTLVADLEGDVTGNADTADAWSTSRTVTFATGDVTGSFTIDGSADVSDVDLSVASSLTTDITGDLTGNLVGAATTAKDLDPAADSTYDMGTSLLRWRNIYVDNLAANEVTETVYALSGTAIDPSNGSIQTKTLSANTTFTYSSFGEGQSVTLMIDDGSAYTATWPSTTWVNNNGSAPTLKTSGYSVVTLWRVDSVYYGAVVGAA